jgi:hypothetical protein
MMAMARRSGLRCAQIRAAVARACRDTLKLSEDHRYGDDDDQLRAKHFVSSFEAYHDWKCRMIHGARASCWKSGRWDSSLPEASIDNLLAAGVAH